MPSTLWIALALVTTGPPEEVPLEMAALRFRGPEAEASFHTLLNPGFPLPHLVQTRTGLQPGQVAHAPRLQEALADLLDHLGSAPIIGHRLDELLEHLRLPGLPNPRCELGALAELFLSGLPDSSPASLRRALGLGRVSERGALGEAQMVQAAFLALWERARALPGALRGELARLAARAEHPARPFFLHLERDEPLSALFDEPVRSLWGLREPERPPPPKPPQTPEPVNEGALVALLRQNGPLARAFPGYEERPQQQEMLSAVARTFNQGGQLLVEAGTGTGKSLAYLLPALTFALANDTSVVIATHTINLQEQLFHKDLPALLSALEGAGLPGNADLAKLRAVLLKGRSHYLCGRRLLQWRRNADPSPSEAAFLLRLLAWLPQTETGDRAELRLTSAEEPLWARVNAAAEACSPAQCLANQRSLCFLARARRRAESAHLVITNHALLLADLALRQEGLASPGSILPDYRYLILDEAHHLEDEATRQLGSQLSARGVDDFLQRAAALLLSLREALRASAVDSTLRQSLSRRIEEIERQTLALRDLAAALFAAIARLTALHAPDSGDYDRRLRLTAGIRGQPAWEEVERAWEPLSLALSTLADQLARLQALLTSQSDRRILGYEERLEEIEAAVAETQALADRGQLLINYPADDTILWCETPASATSPRASRAPPARSEPVLSLFEERTPSPFKGEVAKGDSPGRGPGEGAASLHAAPLHVGPRLRQLLFDQLQAAVLTSATLTVADNLSPEVASATRLRRATRLGEGESVSKGLSPSWGGSFRYLQERLSLEDADTLRLGSPFDYRRAALILLPTDTPAPDQPGYAASVERAIADLARAAEGRALALFTSHAALRAAYRAFKDLLERRGIQVLAQGLDGTPDQLLAALRANPRTLLLGAASFWEGIDVVGEALSLLIMARLPFTVPTDPIFAARSEHFEEPFTQYTLPQAALRLLQGFGRLIRSRTDRGVFVLLDSRLTARSYGRALLASLPDCTVQQLPLAALAPAARSWLEKPSPLDSKSPLP